MKRLPATILCLAAVLTGCVTAEDLPPIMTALDQQSGVTVEATGIPYVLAHEAAALAAKTVDAMVTVEPYNQIAEDDGYANTIAEFYDFDKMPVFMAATPDFAEKNPETIVAYLKAWIDVSKDFKNSPDKVADLIFAYYASKGYTMSKATFTKALARVEVNPGSPADFGPYMQTQAEILLGEKKIKAIPDWKTVLRGDFFKQASA